MRTKLTLKCAAACLLFATLGLPLSTVFAQGTAFTYQGRLNDGTNPANGNYDLKFTLFNTNTSGSLVAGPLTNSPTAVTNGLFTVVLDFGNVFPGADRWLEIAVRTNGGSTFATLSPRQKLTPTPYAIYAANAAQVGGQGATAFVAKAGDTMTGTLNLPANGLTVGTNQLVVSGGKVGIGTASPQAKLDIQGTASMNDNDIYLRAGSDPYHGIGYRAEAQSMYLNGPFIYGFDGGALGGSSPETVSLLWDWQGNVWVNNNLSTATLNVRGEADVAGPLVVDPNGLNTSGALAQGILFGAGSGEGIVSRRQWDPGNNGYGIDFYANALSRVTIQNGGNVGIGTQSPQAKLEIQGGAETTGANDLYDIALSFRDGGFRHWISSRHNSAATGNAIDFYLNTNNAAGGSSAPGVGNVLTMTLDSVNGVKAVGGLVIENRTNDPAGPATGRIWIRTDL